MGCAKRRKKPRADLLVLSSWKTERRTYYSRNLPFKPRRSEGVGR